MKNWLDERIGWKKIKEVLLDRKIPRVTSLHTLGSICLFLFILQVITGIFLAMNYSPSPDHAYDSVRYISEIPGGRFLRGLHFWSATAIVIGVFLHMLRVFFMGSYKFPREATWWTGVGLLLIIVGGFGFTGYLLPWDQKAYWATVVGLNLAKQMPYLGHYIAAIIRGGSEIGAVTLTHFYAFHVLLLPAITMLLLGSHLFLVVWHGISSLPERTKEGSGQLISNDNWKQKVSDRYHELKSQGKPFFPYIVYKDMVAITFVFLAIVWLAMEKGVHLEVVADPTDKFYNPRPEWYFLFLFQLLKYFPGSFEVLAIAVIPVVLIGFLVLLPLIDRGPKRHPFDRPFITIIGVIGLTGMIYLGIEGYYSPLTNPIIEKDIRVLDGQRLFFENFRCQSCHSINGRGGVFGPPLDTVGLRRSKDWLAEHFRDPEKVSPGTKMPNFGMLDNEVAVLVAYTSSLGGGPFTAQAPALFKDNCSDCHKVGDMGEALASDLSGVGQYREQGWIAKYIENPKKMDPKAEMEGFDGILTKEQIEDLSRYLAAQR